jgi:hypothetical protein
MEYGLRFDTYQEMVKVVSLKRKAIPESGMRLSINRSKPMLGKMLGLDQRLKSIFN